MRLEFNGCLVWLSWLYFCDFSCEFVQWCVVLGVVVGLLGDIVFFLGCDVESKLFCLGSLEVVEVVVIEFVICLVYGLKYVEGYGC